MKGIILVAGLGTRMRPMTNYIAKALLPVYDRPAICYSIDLLKSAGVTEILIICDKNNESNYRKLLDCESEFYKIYYPKIKFKYKIQRRALGIPDALRLGKRFVGKDNVCLCLGDNVFLGNVYLLSDLIKWAGSKDQGLVFTKKVKDPEKFGVAVFDDYSRISHIIEKPSKYVSNEAVVGLYVYPNIVFEYLKSLKMSDRGEYEITDLNNKLIRDGLLISKPIDTFIEWFDVGTPEGLARAMIERMKDDGIIFKEEKSE